MSWNHHQGQKGGSFFEANLLSHSNSPTVQKDAKLAMKLMTSAYSTGILLILLLFDTLLLL